MLISSVVNFQKNQVLHVLENVKVASESLELLNLLHDYCFRGLECYIESFHVWGLLSGDGGAVIVIYSSESFGFLYVKNGDSLYFSTDGAIDRT